eukprot:TRINITY_DN18317_c0_g1_i1.p1 TRINITY_DN18317_c0_g1~~TRINITY_DN18317_c0_g1_i1.p1  ORF type:complete len:1035 (+),score=229.56 TRINITY_DN18317_c0_g1_i1:73-3177(+)
MDTSPGGKMIRKAPLPKMTSSPKEKHKRHSSTAEPTSDSDNVSVMVRVRPFSETEIRIATEDEAYMQSVIDMPRSDQVAFLDHNSDYQCKHGFNFDKVFWSCTQQQSDCGFSTQKDVYDSTGKPALESTWDGINTCIFAYGQTGSGKTHTMMGDPSQIASEAGCDDDALGVIPRLCRDLFDEIAQKQEDSVNAGYRKQVHVEVRFLEIYNEKVRDLLVSPELGRKIEHFKETGTGRQDHIIDNQDLRIREHPTTGPYVHGITVFKPTSYLEMIECINSGNQERSTAETKLNDRSSRSHAMFRITLTQTTFMTQERVGIGGPKTISSERRSNINLVDLAGSENVKRSGVTGSTLVEAQKINLSLTTLRRVIDALIENKKGSVVPYRDSTLTWMLRQDLGGNAKTFMLATVSPHYSNAHESQRTLEYAMRARSIVNIIRVNEDDTSKMLADLEKRIKDTQNAMNGASTEEMEQLQTDLSEAKLAKDQLNTRLSKVSLEAEAFKNELASVKEKQTAQAFKNAVVLNMARQRLKAAEDEAADTKSELQQFKDRMTELGHADLDSLQGSLIGHRQLLDDMLREKEGLEEHTRRLRIDEQTLRDSLAKEREELEKEQEVTKNLEKKGIRHNMQAIALRARIADLSDKMQSLLDKHEQEKKMATEHHKKELTAVVKESEELMANHQEKVQELHKEIQQTQEKARRDLRSAAYDSEYQQRLFHSDLEKAQKQIQEERDNTREVQAKLDEANAALAAEKEAHEATKEFHAMKMTEMEKKLEEYKEHAIETGRQLDQKCREKEEVQRYFRGIEKSQEHYERTAEECKRFLDQLHDSGGIPKEWTIEDVRKCVDSFKAYKKEYTSNKPNKEKLRQMLRADPSRPGAERMRTMLSGSSSAEGANVQVIMDGIRCPEIPLSARRSKSVERYTYDPDLYGPTEADKIPYTSDASPEPGLANTYSAGYGRMHSVTSTGSQSRSRSKGSPNGKHGVSPIRLNLLKTSPTLTQQKRNQSPRKPATYRQSKDSPRRTGVSSPRKTKKSSTMK